MWTILSGLGLSSNNLQNSISAQNCSVQNLQSQYAGFYSPIQSQEDYTMCECNAVPDPDTQQTFYSFRIPLTEREDFFELNEILHGFSPNDYILKSSVANSWGDSRLALFVFNDLLAVHLKLKYMGM